jgi:hypothetical protein
MILKLFSVAIFGVFAAFAVTLFLEDALVGALIPAVAGCAIMALYNT